MRPPYPCTSAAHYSQENQTSRSGTSLSGHHPCSRRFSSSQDEAPTDILLNARLWLPGPLGLPLQFCNARWHHRHTAQTSPADISPLSIDQRHSARTDWLTGDWPLHLAECPARAGSADRLPLGLALAANARHKERSTFPWRASLPPASADFGQCYRKSP